MICYDEKTSQRIRINLAIGSFLVILLSPFWLVKNPIHFGPSVPPIILVRHLTLRGDGIYLLVGVVMMPQWGMKKICQERLVGHGAPGDGLVGDEWDI